MCIPHQLRRSDMFIDGDHKNFQSPVRGDMYALEELHPGNVYFIL